MSEEKLYAVKNDVGKYFDCENAKFLPLSKSYCPVLVSEDSAEAMANYYGGHVVTFVEEPKKVVLTKEQAKIVENAREEDFPATYISDSTNLAFSGEEDLLMKAYVNGYTVEKEKKKKYNVKVPYAVNSYFKKIDANYCVAGDNFIFGRDEHLAQFTEAEIEHYGLQDYEKEEVTDD